METDALEQEMNYPNPVERSDLPVKRRRWPKIAIGLGVLLLLTLVLLPQILSSRIGRKIVVGYISGKTNSPVTIESVSTSWFGGTSIRHLTIKDPMGRRIGFKQLRCEASLWKVLRGRYDLGDCTIDDLSIEYVIDDGRGKNSFDYMSGPPTPGGAPPPPTAGSSNELPRLSGKVKLNNATLILWRGTVQPKLFDVTWERARFTGINGEIDIASSLDQPWKYSLSATSVEDGTDQKGAMASSGTVDLGEGGKFSADDLTADITLDGADVRAGPLAAALIPSLTRQEAREIFGPALTKLKLAVKAVDGEVVIQNLDVESPVSRVAARATVDISSTPAVLSISSDSTDQSPSKPVTIALGVSKRLAGNWFVYFNPFLREAVPGSGVVSVTVDSLSMPLSAGGWWTVTAQGRVKAEQVKLARVDEMHDDETTPDNLASQLAMLVGDSPETVPLAFEAPFNVNGGKVKVESAPVGVGPVAMVMSGTTDLRTGAVEMKAAFALAPPQSVGVTLPPLVGALAQARAVFAIRGTVDRPQLMVAHPAGNLDGAIAKQLADQINEQVTKLRAKEAQRMMQKSQKEMDDILKPLRGMDQQHRATTQRATTTAPATATSPK